MRIKLKVQSKRYQSEYFGILYDHDEQTLIAGGKEKFYYEILGLLERTSFFKSTDLLNMIMYSNKIHRFKINLVLYTQLEEFITVLQSMAYQFEYVNALDRLIR
jgi:hypothetical protein